MEVKEYIYNKAKKLKKHIKRISKKLNKNVLFSIGENCLADNILARNGLKSFSSPYSSARSNVEYLIAFEKEEFNDFLNADYLVYDKTSNGNVAQNKKYVDVNNKYYSSCVNGFEFTHHDVIGDSAAKDKIYKRCRRLLRLKNKNVIMLYHHRFCEGTDEKLLIKNLVEMAEIYKLRDNNVHIFLFTQVIVSSKEKRKVENYVDSGINVYKFHTMNAWGGENEEILWARCDDDLLKIMINDIKKSLV